MIELLQGFLTPWAACAWVLLLHLVVPARHIEGYVSSEEGSLLNYRINGLRVLIISLTLWYVLCQQSLLPWDWFWRHRWSGLGGAITMGLLFTFWIVLPANSTGRSLPVDLFLGRLKNPQWFDNRVDAKMFLYLFGAVLLALNILSFAAHHTLAFGGSGNPGVTLYVLLFFWFICDYLLFERVHVYTYDIFAERVGFKLGWGCLAFYPYFYCVGLWSVADLKVEAAPLWVRIVAAIVFFFGWSLARGANMQKFYFKRDPEHVFLGFIKPIAIEEGERKLLCSGFWGLSRHINYLGEILMGCGLALSLGTAEFWPWLYPLYYVLLLVPRQFDDDRRCQAKYGPLWDEYCRRVPRRIIPGVF